MSNWQGHDLLVAAQVDRDVREVGPEVTEVTEEELHAAQRDAADQGFRWVEVDEALGDEGQDDAVEVAPWEGAFGNEDGMSA